eukprot:3067232-Rhodomonas_salina.1
MVYEQPDAEWDSRKLSTVHGERVPCTVDTKSTEGRSMTSPTSPRMIVTTIPPPPTYNSPDPGLTLTMSAFVKIHRNSVDSCSSSSSTKTRMLASP